MLLKVLRRYQTDILVELGSGLGDKLLNFAAALKPRQALGGEFTDAGVACGQMLAKRWKQPAQFVHFDYNDPRTLDFVPPGGLVYTAHSVEQIPQLPRAFFTGLLRRKPACVVHFEPCYEEQLPDSMLGLMRRRYTELNDYNRNLTALVRELESQGRIRILDYQREVFAVSPMNPTSILAWTPANKRAGKRSRIAKP
jgi:hypothetical protein